MKLPELHKFEIPCIQQAKETRCRIMKLLQTLLQDPQRAYMNAVDTAIRHAICCTRKSSPTACLTVDIFVHEGDIETEIVAGTKLFDVWNLRKDLMRLLAQGQYGDMTWQTYTKITGKEQTIWRMLCACEYLILDAGGERIALCARRPFSRYHVMHKIKNIVPRFYIEKEGVLF
ncbi:hypothetical protein [uncultured Mitsuokella sp.]|uniref:hypothetical protein n=1 Tax=uncultured Mitsuokella sp. TaxID=453120 RepID=UPI00260C5D9C|nr:hypothetical protein [uncultured Mitsuokella sp.]